MKVFWLLPTMQHVIDLSNPRVDPAWSLI